MGKSIFIALFFIIGTQLAHADCSELALLFSQSPDSMELNELGALKKCVSDELRKKLFSGVSPSVPMPAPEPEPAPMPIPQPAPPIMPAPPGQ